MNIGVQTKDRRVRKPYRINKSRRLQKAKILQQEDWYYLFDYIDSIYKVRKDSSQKVLLYTAAPQRGAIRLDHFKLIGDWLYFTDHSQLKKELFPAGKQAFANFRVRTDGTGLTAIHYPQRDEIILNFACFQ